MIENETKEGPIFAEADISGIPINLLRSPSMEHIDPIRRWQEDAERVWSNQPWFVASGKEDHVFCIRPTETQPKLWGVFETLRAAIWYVLDAPEPTSATSWSDSDLDF